MFGNGDRCSRLTTGSKPRWRKERPRSTRLERSRRRVYAAVSSTVCEASRNRVGPFQQTSALRLLPSARVGLRSRIGLPGRPHAEPSRPNLRRSRRSLVHKTGLRTTLESTFFRSLRSMRAIGIPLFRLTEQTDGRSRLGAGALGCMRSSRPSSGPLASRQLQRAYAPDTASSQRIQCPLVGRRPLFAGFSTGNTVPTPAWPALRLFPDGDRTPLPSHPVSCSGLQLEEPKRLDGPASSNVSYRARFFGERPSDGRQATGGWHQYDSARFAGRRPIIVWMPASPEEGHLAHDPKKTNPVNCFPQGTREGRAAQTGSGSIASSILRPDAKGRPAPPIRVDR